MLIMDILGMLVYFASRSPYSSSSHSSLSSSSNSSLSSRSTRSTPQTTAPPSAVDLNAVHIPLPSLLAPPTSGISSPSPRNAQGANFFNFEELRRRLILSDGDSRSVSVPPSVINSPVKAQILSLVDIMRAFTKALKSQPSVPKTPQSASGASSVHPPSTPSTGGVSLSRTSTHWW
jgi:hypothetical protein